MALSIFSPVPDWASSVVYSKYTIVKYLGKIYYGLVDHTSAGTFDTTKWGGHVTDPFGSVISNEDSTDSSRPHFFFTPSYGNTVNSEPRTMITQFGEGYQQRVPESINNTFLKISVVFENRTAKEATAMLHFLNARNGTEAFLYTPPEPYPTMRLFSCFNWNQQSQFLNNININAEFTEVSV